jgi:hypothetical protein
MIKGLLPIYQIFPFSTRKKQQELFDNLKVSTFGSFPEEEHDFRVK